MNLKEAREIVATSKTCTCEDHMKAEGFLEGYEAGVREAAKIIGGCLQPNGPQPDECISCVLRKEILKLLEEGKV